jgi:hypothetical protein
MRRDRLAVAVACLALLAVGTASAQKGVTIVKTAYKGWKNCYRMTNGQIELIATQDVGPRIIRFGFVGGQNVFGENDQQVGKTGGDEWRIYGGHRLWHAPEGKPRSYWPDNTPIEVKEGQSSLTLIQPTEVTTGIQKTIELAMHPERNHVVVVHRLRNDNLWPVELAAWALTMMNKNGMAIIPQPPFAPHETSLLPARPIVQWTYTDMADPRWRWGTKYITLRQDPTATKPQKIGIGNRENWVAYAVNDNLFIKTFQYKKDATYPDFGCTVEVFTNADMLEAETLGPMTVLEPGQSLQYTENWFLAKGVSVADEDASIDASVLPEALRALQMSSAR